MSVDHELEKLLEKAKVKWDSLTPKQQAKYLREKAAELDQKIKDLEKPPQ